MPPEPGLAGRGDDAAAIYPVGWETETMLSSMCGHVFGASRVIDVVTTTSGGTQC
jgi:hypothetical protein